MLSFAKLWDLLEKRGMKKTDLKEVISGNTLAKLGKNETISSAVIEKLCEFLDCQPSDIMEYVSEEKIKKVANQFDGIHQDLLARCKEQGLSEEEFICAISELMPLYVKKALKGENPMQQILEASLHAPEVGTTEE